MIPLHFLIPILVFGFFALITQSIGGGILFLLMYLIIIKLFNQSIVNDKLKNRQNIDNLNLIRHNLPLNQQNEFSKVDNIGFGRSYVNFKNLERDSMKESMVKLSQISLKKWFLVIIPLILFVFLAIFFSASFYYNFIFTLFLNFVVVVFYYIFIGIVYLVSELITKIYNSKSFQKIEQKTQNKTNNNSSEQTGIRNKIKSNLLSNWHFWTILVFNFVINWGISAYLLPFLILQIILSTDSAIEILPIYLSLLIFGLFLALVFFGIKNRINSILLATILTVSLLWSLTNIYIVNTYYNFTNFSTCQDFRIIKQNESIYYLNNNEMEFLSNLERVNYEFEIKIEDYKIKQFQNSGKIEKLDKIKNCLISTFENKKVILIEEKARPEFPFSQINPNLPLPSDLPINLPSDLPPIPSN